MRSEGYDRKKEQEAMNKSSSLQQSCTTLRYNNISELRKEYEDEVNSLKEKNRTLGGLLLQERRKNEALEIKLREKRSYSMEHELINMKKDMRRACLLLK